MPRTARSSVPVPDLFPSSRPPAEVFRDVRNYLAGQMVGATRDESLLHEVIKVLFVKLKLEKAGQDGTLPSDPIEGAKVFRQYFAKIRVEYPELFQPDEELLLDPRSLEYVIRSLSFSLLSATRDPVGELFQSFAGSESRGGKGQFFTPKNAVDLLVNAVEPKIGELIIDPACGAGGFLAAVVQRWRATSAPEADIAAAVSERLIGVEKDDYLAELARAHLALLTDAHSRVTSGDSLAWTNGDGNALHVPPVGSYDVVLTNPPFGAKIVAASPEVLRQFELGHKWFADKEGNWGKGTVLDQAPPQVLFIERCLTLLKQGGRLGIVVPESVVSNKSYEHVIAYLKRHARISAVIGMPESLFKTSGKGGTHTKTCLIVAQKGEQPDRRAKVFMAEAKWCGHDSRGRSIPHNDLPAIAKAYAAFKAGKPLNGSNMGFTVTYKEIAEGAVCPRYFDPTIETSLEELEASHELVTVAELLKEQVLAISTGDEVGKLAYGTGDVPFVRTSDISSWEIKVDPKHLISEDIYKNLARKQDVRAGDILMVRDGTYLIGSCALVSEYDTRIVYQSHLYKIRVRENAHGLTPYLLLAILSSPIVQRQIRAKQFTQDIIDSLGRRINELILPIPKAANRREEISAMVKEAVDVRVKARELSRRARLAVVEPH